MTNTGHNQPQDVHFDDGHYHPLRHAGRAVRPDGYVISDMTALHCGSLQSHLGTLMQSGGRHFINAHPRHKRGATADADQAAGQHGSSRRDCTTATEPPASPPVSSPLPTSNRSNHAPALKRRKNRGAHSLKLFYLCFRHRGTRHSMLRSFIPTWTNLCCARSLLF